MLRDTVDDEKNVKVPNFPEKMYKYCSSTFETGLKDTNVSSSLEINTNNEQEALLPDETECYFTLHPRYIKVPNLTNSYSDNYHVAATADLPVPETLMDPSFVPLSSSLSSIYYPPSVSSSYPSHVSFQHLYDDIFGLTSDNNYELNPVISHVSAADNPLNDPYFMTFLASLPSSSGSGTMSTTATIPVSQNPSQLPSQQTHLVLHDLQQANIPDRSSTDISASAASKRKKLLKRKTYNGNDKATANKLGQCEHPKHVLYRQEKHTFVTNPTDSMILKTIPRRGRPPKGAKLVSESLASGSLNGDSPTLRSTLPPTTPLSHSLPVGSSIAGTAIYNNYYHYPIVELTVRPLPKRLEAVVGRSNIKVCLTCLKRSDMDPEYLESSLYVRPQQQHHHSSGEGFNKKKRTKTT